MKNWKHVAIAVVFGLVVNAGAQVIGRRWLWHSGGYNLIDENHKVYAYTDGNAEVICIEATKTDGYAMSCVQVKP